MALIKCPECGKEISDRAAACNNCGFPLSELKNENIFKSGGGTVGSPMDQGGDISFHVTLTFEEACYGVQKDVLINRLESCSACQGTGTKAAESFSGGQHIQELCPACQKGLICKNISLRVAFPAAIEHGQFLKIPGEGNRNNKTAEKAGNLFLIVHVASHKLYKRNGLDLLLDFPITPKQALQGEKIRIPMLNGGEIAFPLSENTENGTIFKLKGMGVKNPKNDSVGDILVTVKIVAN